MRTPRLRWTREEVDLITKHATEPATSILVHLKAGGYSRTRSQINDKRQQMGLSDAKRSYVARGWPVVPETVEEQNRKFLSAVLDHLRQERAA